MSASQKKLAAHLRCSSLRNAVTRKHGCWTDELPEPESSSHGDDMRSRGWESSPEIVDFFCCWRERREGPLFLQRGEWNRIRSRSDPISVHEKTGGDHPVELFSKITSSYDRNEESGVSWVSAKWWVGTLQSYWNIVRWWTGALQKSGQWLSF